MTGPGPDLVAVWEVQLPDGIHIIQAGVNTNSLPPKPIRTNLLHDHLHNKDHNYDNDYYYDHYNHHDRAEDR
jgi:hypothetical protein